MNLIKQVAAGNMEAMQALYEMYKAKVYRLALSMVKDTYRAEDIMQETFYKVQQKSCQYTRQVSEQAWIMSIARNLSLDELRRLKRESVNADGNYAEQSLVFTENYESEFLDMLKVLKKVDQEIVCLYLIAGLKHREIANLLDMHTQGVKKRYQRAIAKLKAEYLAEGVTYAGQNV